MLGLETPVKNTILVRLKRKAVTYFTIAIAVFLALTLFRNLSNVKNVENKIAQKEKEVERIRTEQKELEKKLEFAQSNEFIEKQLRDKLGLVKDGEIVVILPPSEVVRKFAPKYAEEEEVLPDPNWKKWKKLFI